jgi:hypothetical protein
MTMIPINQVNASLPPETSPSASSFKKPLPRDNAKISLSKQRQQAPKRRGADDSLRASKPKQTREPHANDVAVPASAAASTQQMKQVSFARTAKVKKVRSRQHYSEEERDGMWYTPDEYIDIKKRAVQTLRIMMADPSFRDDSEHTSRGLESRTKDAARQRKEFKAHSRELVLEEQENQREAGVHSPGRLREAYQEMSLTATRQARMSAQRDELERITESIEHVIRLVKFENGMR